MGGSVVCLERPEWDVRMEPGFGEGCVLIPPVVVAVGIKARYSNYVVTQLRSQ